MKDKTPTYAIRLVILVVFAGIIFFGGLSLFIPEGSRLTGSYDAESLLYIADAPVAYGGSASCGAGNCHEGLYKKWLQGAHGIKQEQSKCEVCHGPLGEHPNNGKKLPLVRGDGNIVELCLTCHRQMKARSTTGQPQIVPQEHPYPHEGVLRCTQCHNPHSPAIGPPRQAEKAVGDNAAGLADKKTEESAGSETTAPAIAANCFSCHGQKGRGGFAPVLAAQSPAMLTDKLNKFKTGELKGSMMNGIAAGLKEDEIKLLAQYFSALP